MICKKDHRYLNEYNSLPEAQDNQNGDRHIRAGYLFHNGLIPQKNLKGKTINFWP